MRIKKILFVLIFTCISIFCYAQSKGVFVISQSSTIYITWITAIDLATNEIIIITIGIQGHPINIQHTGIYTNIQFYIK